MRRLFAPVILAAVLVSVAAAPVLAIKPVGSCPNTRFVSMDYQQFRALSLSVGVPESLLGPEHQAGWDSFDKNNDGSLCVMDLPDTHGTLDGWVFNVIDNTARAR